VKQKSRWQLPALCFVFFASISACNKLDTTTIGNSLIPAVDNVNTFDTTLAVETRNFLFTDSVFVSPYEDHALGTIENDPLFGKTTASIQVQFKPNGYGGYPFNAKEEEIVAIDSVVLTLSYSGAYGDTNLLQKVNVYEVDPSSDMYINTATHVPYPILGQQVNEPGTGIIDIRRFRDSMEIKNGPDTVKLVNQLRIKLDTTLVGRTLVSYDTTNAYKNDSSFNANHKGFVLVTDSTFGSNALMYFNLYESNSSLIVYYKTLKEGNLDTTFTVFGFAPGYSANANFVRRTYTGSPAGNYLANGNIEDDEVYIDALPGLFSTVDIPGLTGLSNRIVHKAELILETIPDPANEIFYAPSTTYLEAIDTGNHFITLIDPQFISNGTPNTSVFGGTLKTFKNEFNQTVKGYTFDLTRYVQMIATNQTNNFQLRLTAPVTAYAPYSVFNYHPQLMGYYMGFSATSYNVLARGRVRVGGGNHPTNKMRLRIIYSKL